MCGRCDDLHDAKMALNEAEEAGRIAALDGMPEEANPHTNWGNSNTEYFRWRDGWESGRKQIAVQD